MGANCLDELEALAVAEGQAAGEVRIRAARHLDECSECRQLVAELGRLHLGDDTRADPLPRLGGRYRAVRCLGRGPLGAVYEAQDLSLETTVAVKVVRLECFASASAQAALRRAVAAHRRVAHPGVCQLYDLDRSAEGFLITEDLAPGNNLEIVSATEALGIRECVSIVLSICDALSAVHRANLAHGDLKPRNVLLDPGGSAIITDVGLAAASDAPDIIAALRERSPEQRAGEPATSRSDIFALGRLLFRLIDRATTGDNAPGHLAQMPASLRPILARCLSEVPAQRFESADTLANVLRESVQRATTAVGQTLVTSEATRSWSGTLLAERFEVGERVAHGGMGVVYQAKDLTGSSSVAIKVLLNEQVNAMRFEREARALAMLTHPAIVRYIAHGCHPVLGRYLVMEWVAGVTLANRLAEGPLNVADALAVIRAVASAVAHAHRAGVVHRDLKPQNIMIGVAAPSDIKVLDFGLTRHSGVDPTLTRPGAIMGTPGYMSPEQARGDEEVDARADVFAIGAMLYECVAGKRPFEGKSPMAVLAKTVLSPTPSLSDACADVPPLLSELVARMLSKDREGRPRDASEVAHHLTDLLHQVEASGLQVSVQRLTRAERAVFTVLMLKTRRRSSETRAVTETRVRAIAAPYGALVEYLMDGTFVLSWRVGTRNLAQLQPVLRCALELRQGFEGLPLAIVTDTGQLEKGSLVGEVLEECAHLLEACTDSAPILVDDTTAQLATSRFELEPHPRGHVLVGESSSYSEPRRVLGKPTPIVGRDSELRILETLIAECITHRRARAVVISGVAGIGKSRVRHEALRAASSAHPRLLVWHARGDATRDGSAFGMIADALRGASGISEGEPAMAQRAKLLSLASRFIAKGDLRRICEFLAEAIGIAPAAKESVQMRSARQDAALMYDQISRAWIELVGAAAAAGPMLLVLEDLHWGDRGSAKLIDDALRALGDLPLFVMAVARPELRERFGDLWARRDVTELKLAPLREEACQELARAVLGSMDDVQLDALAKQAAGNAFFLEEILRAYARGVGAEIPKSVLAVVQSRVAGLDADVRRVLRAAAVFGESFWDSGVAALLGLPNAQELEQWLLVLVEQEVVTTVPTSRLAAHQQYAFRHVLVRDATYQLLTDDDRRLGHRIAGEWLEAAGVKDAVMLADHYEKGTALAEARRWWQRAAEAALAATDLTATLRYTERALECGATGSVRGNLLLLSAEARQWAGQHQEGVAPARAAAQLLEVGSAEWCDAQTIVAESIGGLSDAEGLREIARSLLAIPSKEASPPLTTVCARVVTCLRRTGANVEAAELLQHLQDMLSDVEGLGPRREAFLHQMLAQEAFHAGHFGTLIAELEKSVRGFESAGDFRWAARDHANVGYGYMLLGVYDVAELELCVARNAAEQMGVDFMARVVDHNLAMVRLRQGRISEARELEALAAAAFEGSRSLRLLGFSRIYQARIELEAKQPTTGLPFAQAAVEILTDAVPTLEPYALAVASQCHLELGDAAVALTLTTRATQIMADRGRADEGEPYVHMAHLFALLAGGQREAAATAVSAARGRLLERAGRLDDTLRRSFLQSVPENACVMRLAAELLGQS